MAHATRTFRIFVSSTFSDLVAERNALQARVWPRLRELCERRGARFQAIDLRWGVSDEASLDQRTMTICLEEIDRCRRITPRPNFIVLLGDRYGWRPLPPHIAAEHYVAIERLLSADDRALLTAWYRRDDNAVPPVYELQPRIQVAVAPPAPDPIAEVSPDVQEVLAWIEQELAALEQSAPEDGRQRPERGEHGHQSTLLACYQRLRELGARRPFQEVDLEAIQSTERDLWGHIESDLVTTLQGVAPDVGLEVADLYAFEASATEQEIRRGALRVEGPEQHVLCFFRRIRNRGDLEVAARAGRPGSDFLDVDGAGNPDTAAQARLEALKAELRRQLPEGNILDLDAEWVGPEEGPVLPVYGEAGPATEPEAAGTVGKEPAQPERSPIALKHLDRLCDAVYAALERTIEAELKSFERLDSVTREREAHWQFGRDRAAHFKGRREQLGKIADYLARDTPQPLVVYGPSGSGKSALIAEAARRTVPLELRDLGEPPAAETGPVLVQRFIGATPGASDGRALLEGMCAELAQLYGQGAKAPSDYNELVQELPRRIGLASDERPLYLFLDALDQLSERDGATSLAWLPSTLPDYARVVVSVLSDGPPARLAHLVEDDHLLEVPPLSGKEAEELLTTWLGSVGRRLEPEQQGEVMDRFKLSRLVLYLKLAFEEARHWRSFTSAAETSLPPDVPGIIRALFVRLAQGEHHGPLLVERSLAYLGAGRGGLSEDELLDVLSADAEVLVEFRRHSPRSPATDRLPPVVWSRLYFDLEPYLAEHAADGATLLAFYHRQLAEVVAADFLTDGVKPERHAALMKYFMQPYETLRYGQLSFKVVRMLSELPYHQTMAGQSQALYETLTSHEFLDAKCSAGMVDDLVDDYDFALEATPLVASLSGLLHHYRDFLRRHAQRLSRYPGLWFALVQHEGPLEARARAESLAKDRLWRKPWISTSQAWIPEAPLPEAEHPQLAVLTSFEFGPTAAAELAPERHLAFYVRKLGQIGVVDLRDGLEQATMVSVRPLRPLAMFSALDGSFLVVAFDNGQVDLYRLDFNRQGTLSSCTHLVTFGYLIPEFEAPVMLLVERELWYQAESGAIERRWLDGLGVPARAVELPWSAPDAELSAIIATDSRVALVLRHVGGSVLMSLAQGRSDSVHSFAKTDVVALCGCGGDVVAVALSDRTVAVFDLGAAAGARVTTRVDEPLACLFYQGDTLLCITESGRWFAWSMISGVAPRTVEGIGIAGFRPRRAASMPGDTFALITLTAALQLKLASRGARRGYNVLEAFGIDATCRYRAICSRDNGLWLLGGARRSELPLIEGSQLDHVFGLDGASHLFGARSLGQGFLLDLDTDEAEIIPGVPPSITAVAGSPHGGFWLVDTAARLFFVGLDRSCRQIGHLRLEAVGRSQLWCWPGLVVWSGDCLQTVGTGATEVVDAFVFFEPRHGPQRGLRPIGQRFFASSQGRFQTLAYSREQRVIIAFWEGGSTYEQSATIGTPREYVDEHERHRGLGEMDHGILQAGVIDPLSLLYILSKRGNVFCLDSRMLELRAVLAPSTGFSSMRTDPGHSNHLVAVQGRSRVVCCVLEGAVPG